MKQSSLVSPMGDQDNNGVLNGGAYLTCEVARSDLYHARHLRGFMGVMLISPCMDNGAYTYMYAPNNRRLSY